MAKIKVEDVIDYFDNDIRKVLESTLKEHFPNQSFDTRAIFRTFKRQVRRKCHIWENVPDKYVQKD
ncbi:MAG: hypothetical protein WC679_07110 [Bacteroidales bacterium]|jgi:hypothetical protein